MDCSQAESKRTRLESKSNDVEEISLPDCVTANQIDTVEVDIPPEHHQLEHNYWIWLSQKKKHVQGNLVTYAVKDEPYDHNLKLIGSFGSVEQFWGFYSHMVRPSEMPLWCDIHYFKVGIKPMWEDGANSNGGQWIIRLRKGLASRCWENLLLAMIGENFKIGDELCGIVISSRLKEDILQVWNKTASDQTAIRKIKDTMKKILPSNAYMEYKTHSTYLHNPKIGVR